MGTFQQKLLLKGSEESIEYFTSVLKVVKDGAGLSTAVALLQCLGHWEASGSLSAVCRAGQRWETVSYIDIYIYIYIIYAHGKYPYFGKTN